MHPTPRSRFRAFTMVEMLTVIAIIGLLLGLLLPALAGAKKTSHKTREFNNLRQVGLAWTLYANNHNEYVLPGYLEPAVQARWQVLFDYPRQEEIDPTIAAPWPWRLAQFLDHSLETLHGYAEVPNFDTLLARGSPAVDLDENAAQEIANSPAFGYNAYYVGGWWTMLSIGSDLVARYRFYDNPTATFNCRGNAGTIQNARVVARSTAEIRRSEELVVFCSSAAFAGAASPSAYKGLHDNSPGSHLVVPPVLADDPQWRVAEEPGGDVDLSLLEILTATSAPIGRYSGNAAILYADVHTAAKVPGSLTDPASPHAWIEVAPCVTFTHAP